MAVQVRDGDYNYDVHQTSMIVNRDLCVYTLVDGKGNKRFVINEPPLESGLVKDQMDKLITAKPKELSDNFQRTAMIMRVMLFLLVAASEKVHEAEMRKVATEFNEIYENVCFALENLMIESSESLRDFTTACFYFDEEKDELGKEALLEMQSRLKNVNLKFKGLSSRIKQLQDVIEKLLERLQVRREKLGGNYDAFVTCLTECITALKFIKTAFLEKQGTMLEAIGAALDLERHCSKIKLKLDVRSFRQLTEDVTAGGFHYEIHSTIIRWLATKKMSSSYIHELNSKDGSFAQMVAAFPSIAIARENVSHLIREYNETFPRFALNKGVAERIEGADWTEQPKPEKDGWACAIL